MAHLLRRAGFGASPEEIHSYLANGHEATPSTWGEERLTNNPKLIQDRNVAKDLHFEKLFCRPRDIKVDGQGMVFVVDCTRGRIQVHRKAG